jgi:hypothetical protein
MAMAPSCFPGRADPFNDDKHSVPLRDATKSIRTGPKVNLIHGAKFLNFARQ